MSQQKISPARIYLLLVIMISISGILGIILAMGKIGKIYRPINPMIDKCNEKVKFSGSNCEALHLGYEFDSGLGKCIIKTGPGGTCSVDKAFNSMEECQKACENAELSGNELLFETIIKGVISSQKDAKNFVIKSQSEWMPALQKTDAELPALIDFDKDMAIAVFQGEKTSGGYNIEISKIIENNNDIEVLIKETSPGADCITPAVITSPYQIVKLQKSEKEVVYKTEKVIINCKKYY